MLSAARVPASWDERKSKHPEDVSGTHAVSGSSLEEFFLRIHLLAEIEGTETVWVELPDATWTEEIFPGWFDSLTMTDANNF